MTLQGARLIEALAIVAGLTLVAGFLLLVAMAVSGVVLGEPDMTALGVFLTSAAVALGAWSEARSLVYNDATARRRMIARRIAAIAGVIAATAFFVLKVVLPG